MSTYIGTKDRTCVSPGKDSIEFSIAKVLEQVRFICGSYGQAFLKEADELDAYRHDLAVMLEYGDLKQVRLQLLDKDQKVIGEFCFEFSDHDRTTSFGRAVDFAKGIELLWITASEIRSNRFVITHNGKLRTYMPLLKIHWGDAKELEKLPGRAFSSAHASGRLLHLRCRRSLPNRSAHP